MSRATHVNEACVTSHAQTFWQILPKTQRAHCLTAHLSASRVPNTRTICQQTHTVSEVYLMHAYIQQKRRGIMGFFFLI